MEKPEGNDDDIASFLHATGPRSEAAPWSAPLAPRLDVTAASRQPLANTSDQDDRIVDVYRRPKPRQNKGLRVKFESASPAIIGLGGDEAELPSRDVSRPLAHLLRPERSSSQNHCHYTASDQRPEAHGRSIIPYNETSFRSPSLQRRPTGVHEETPAKELHHAGHDRETVQSTSVRTQELSPPRRDGQQCLDRELRERNDRYVSCNHCTASEEVSYDHSYNRQTAQMENQETNRHLNVSVPKALPTLPLFPNEPPELTDVFREASSSIYHVSAATEDTLKLSELGHQGNRQDSQVISDDSIDKQLSIHSVAESLGDESLEDFDVRVRRLNKLFRLNSSAHVDIMALPLEQWVRISAWWFLRGRRELEDAVRAKSWVNAPASVANGRESSSILKQAYLNLAKAWWIVRDVIPALPATKRFGTASMSSKVAMMRNYGEHYHAELLEVHLTMVANFRALTQSMRRNGRLPPNDLQMERLESQIFLEIPTFPPKFSALTVNNILDPTIKGKNSVTDPFFPLLVGDTPRHFSFCKVFVDVVLDYNNDAKYELCIPCVVLILRQRTDRAVKAVITSQDGQLNLVIQSGDGGLDWHAVKWKISSHTMQLGIMEGVCLQIKFSEKDFKTIWGICDYTQRIRKEYSARRGEEVVYERELPMLQCFDCPSFPAEPVKDCSVRLFASVPGATKDSGQPSAHDGCRLVVITPPGTKAMSKVNCQLEKDSLVLFGSQSTKGANTLFLRVPSSLRMSLTFHEACDVELFRSTISGTLRTEDDYCSIPLQLQGLSISPVSADQEMAYMNASSLISEFQWHRLRVVSRGSPNHGTGHGSELFIRPEHVRILAYCEIGTFADQITAGPGELQLNLSVDNMYSIKFLRAAQQHMTWSFADGVLGEAELSSLSHWLHLMSASPSMITYHFRSSSDLHSFQAMLTGFHVLYDGLASTFSITRRRSVVPVHKRWNASTPRVQIVKQDKIVQLVAFFKDFSHGACMNFTLKVTDSFDTFTRSGVSFLRIVDAKFALPKGESDPAREFVCLDVPDYPGEHDDIIIGFDNEEGKHVKRHTG